MKIQFDKSFIKSLEKINDASVKDKITAVISSIEDAETLAQIKHLKKMKGYKAYYRIKIGSYRIGIELTRSDIITFILASHRKDIYKNFP